MCSAIPWLSRKARGYFRAAARDVEDDRRGIRQGVAAKEDAGADMHWDGGFGH